MTKETIFSMLRTEDVLTVYRPNADVTGTLLSVPRGQPCEVSDWDTASFWEQLQLRHHGHLLATLHCHIDIHLTIDIRARAHTRQSRHACQSQHVLNDHVSE